MATNLKTWTTILSTLLVSLFLSPSLAALPFSPEDSTTCDITPYPSFCTTTLPPQYYSSSIHDQARFFLQQSLSTTKTTLELISSYLREYHLNDTIPDSTVHALVDCLSLAELNTDFLSNVLQQTNETTTTNMSSHQAYDMQTLLSAVLTNQQTCLDGFHEVTTYPRITSGSSIPLSMGLNSIAYLWHFSPTVGLAIQQRRQLR